MGLREWDASVLSPSLPVHSSLPRQPALLEAGCYIRSVLSWIGSGLSLQVCGCDVRLSTGQGGEGVLGWIKGWLQNLGASQRAGRSECTQNILKPKKLKIKTVTTVKDSQRQMRV